VTTAALALQVWNANACNAVVGAFNLQGSSWDRTRRQYRIHNSRPPTLDTEVRVLFALLCVVILLL
jgi:hypothetical protein